MPTNSKRHLTAAELAIRLHSLAIKDPNSEVRVILKQTRDGKNRYHRGVITDITNSHGITAVTLIAET